MSREFIGYAVFAVATLVYFTVNITTTMRARAALRAASGAVDRDPVVSAWVKASSRAQWALEAMVIVAACIVLSANPRDVAASGMLLALGALFLWLTSGVTVRSIRRWAPFFLGPGTDPPSEHLHDEPA